MRNIAENLRVALVIDHYDEDWRRLAYVLIHGDAWIVEDAAEYALAIQHLRDKYTQYRAMPLTQEKNPMVRIEPRHVHAWGARFKRRRFAMSRIEEIQTALAEAKLDGWLFYDFRLSDPLAYRILELPEHGIATRRWFCFVPRAGEPHKLVSAVESHRLDTIAGTTTVYRSIEEMRRVSPEFCTARNASRWLTRRIARFLMSRASMPARSN